MRQSWRHLGFVHWEVEATDIAAARPGAGWNIDAFDGRCYVGLVPFTMHGVRPLWLPRAAVVFDFHEINVPDLRSTSGGAIRGSISSASMRPAVSPSRRDGRSSSCPTTSPPWTCGERPEGSSTLRPRHWPGPRPAGCRLAYGPVGRPPRRRPAASSASSSSATCSTPPRVVGGGAGASTMRPIRCKRRNARSSRRACCVRRESRGPRLRPSFITRRAWTSWYSRSKSCRAARDGWCPSRARRAGSRRPPRAPPAGWGWARG